MMTHLFIKSCYSLLESTIKISNLTKRLNEDGFKFAALVETNTMHGAIEFQQKCKASGITPISGLDVEVDFGTNHGRFILLAKNQAGYKNLIKISSLVMTSDSKRITLDNFNKLNSELVIITHPTKSILNSCIPNDKTKMVALANRLSSDLGEDFYVGYSIPANANEKTYVEIVKELDVKSVFANLVNHLDEGQSESVKVLEAISKAKTLGQITSDYTNNYLLNKEELAAATDETMLAEIVNKCKEEIILKKAKLPVYPTQNGLSTKVLLTQLCKKGLEKRLNGNVTAEYVERIKFELDTIFSLGFEDYFLITWDFIKFAKQNNILVGPGRGSAAGSLVSYCLGITGVDPLEYNLLFERFLNPERVTMPDIDIDFQDTRRDEVIAYVHNKYGNDHVAHIATFQTMAAKMSLRDAGRALGMSLPVVDQISKLVPNVLNITLQEAYDSSLRFRSEISRKPDRLKLYEIAKSIEGLPRQAGTHAAGIVLTAEKLSETVPVMAGYSGVNMTQYSMGYLEDLGILKMDFLGLRNLTVIDNVVKKIKEKKGIDININTIPLDDANTFKIIANADTAGIFQLESAGMRKALRQMKSDSFNDIVATIALYRPGPMANIPHYIARKHGREEVKYIHNDLKPILEDTYGIIVYQEQIMQIAQEFAGFSFGKADILRRAMGKKVLSMMQKLEVEFIAGAKAKGYNEVTAKEIYELIYKFADYGFNKSHSVSYALIGYQLAYLKANYPLEFTASLLSSSVGNAKNIRQYIIEGKKYGIKFEGPSIVNSTDSFEIVDDKIYYSLVSLKQVGQAAYIKIKNERGQKPFDNTTDTIVRLVGAGVSKATINSLIWSGAFDVFGDSRTGIIETLDDIYRYADLVKGNDGQIMFDIIGVPKPAISKTVDKQLESDKEFDYLGLYFSAHPLRAIKESIKGKITDIADIDENMKNKIAVCGMVRRINTIKTKKGDNMAFVTVGDETGEISVTVFSRQLERFGQQITNGATVVIIGKVEQRQETNLILEDMKLANTLGGDNNE